MIFPRENAIFSKSTIFVLPWKSKKNMKRTTKNASKSMFVFTRFFLRILEPTWVDFGSQVEPQDLYSLNTFPSSVQEASKRRPRGSQESQERPKSAPREPQERPKSAQERLKRFLKHAKCAPETPRTCQGRLRTPQERPKTQKSQKI